MDWKEKYETLSRSSKIFESSETYKGGRGALAPRPPFVVFSATQNCSDWCLSLLKMIYFITEIIITNFRAFSPKLENKIGHDLLDMAGWLWDIIFTLEFIP